MPALARDDATGAMLLWTYANFMEIAHYPDGRTPLEVRPYRAGSSRAVPRQAVRRTQALIPPAGEIR